MKHKKAFAVILASLLVLIGGYLVISWRGQMIETDDGTTAESTNNVYTLTQIAAHNTAQDCWTIIDGAVYDITEYISVHPGGDEILRACGTDATSMFTQRKTNDGEVVGSGTPHSRSAERQLETYKVGEASR